MGIIALYRLIRGDILGVGWTFAISMLLAISGRQKSIGAHNFGRFAMGISLRWVAEENTVSRTVKIKIAKFQNIFLVWADDKL